MVKHTGKKPFKCELCSIRFTQKSNMKHHMKRSHGYGELMASGWARPSVGGCAQLWVRRLTAIMMSLRCLQSGWAPSVIM